MPRKRKNRLGQTGKRRAFLAVLFGAAAVCTLWFTAHPIKLAERNTLPETDKAPAQEPVPYYSMNLTGTARANLAREYFAYNVSYAPQTYYAQLGTLRDASGREIYGLQTLPQTEPEKSYAYHLGRLGMYLYGDTGSLAESLMGTEALMRSAPVTSESFITGDSLQLSLHTALEQPIWQLLLDNGISGGCIIQDTQTGRIEVMTATSVSAGNETGTEYEALHLEKSGLTQLEACIDAEAVARFSLPDEALADYFDYHALSSVRTAVNPENKLPADVLRYHFMTDFDLLDESADGKLSPLHLNSVTQRIFSGRVTEPTLIAAKIRPTEEGGEEILEQQPKIGEDIPKQLLENCRDCYDRILETDNAHLQYIAEGEGSFLYVTGRITTRDGKADKCFTLYARNVPDGYYTRNRCIFQLPRCIAYYLAHEEELEA